MEKCPGKIESIHEEVIDYGHPPKKIKLSYHSLDDVTFRREEFDRNRNSKNEKLRIFQAVLLSIYMLLLSYLSVRYGRTEYSILENGEIAQGYVNKAVVTLGLSYSMPYSMISFLAVGMLACSLIWKNPRWSLPSIVLYLADLIYDVSGAIVAIWLFFSRFPFIIALFYTTVTSLLILGQIWVWLGVLRLYEQRTFK